MAGIVVISNFVVGNNKKNYSGIIDYYERYEEKNTRIQNEKEVLSEFYDYEQDGGDETLFEFINNTYDNPPNINFGNYINYMNKNIKSSGLFGDDTNHFTSDEKEVMKEAFNKGQENGSVLWGNVYSFDNEFLKKHKLYDEETGFLNEIKIKEAVRSSIRTMLKEEKIDSSAVWCGEIHYDTDNIHVHTSIVEMKNTRPIVMVEKMKKLGSKHYEPTGEFELQPKAKLKKKTLDNMKSVFANKLIDRSKDMKAISDLRTSLHHSIKLDDSKTSQIKLLNTIRKNLPKEKSKWQYNNKEMKNLRPLIDNYTMNYIKTNNKKDYQVYTKLLKDEEDFYKDLYGEGKDNRYKDPSKNKLEDLKGRMGNALLKELKKEHRSMTYKNYNGNINNEKTKVKNSRLVDRNKYIDGNLKTKSNGTIKFKPPITPVKVNQAVRSTFRSYRRNRELEFEHDKLQSNIQRDLERQRYESEYGR